MKKIKNVKMFLLFLIIFIILLAVTPMFVWQTGCGGGGLNFGCNLKTSIFMYFPMYRSIVCVVWNKPGCAYGTFLPGWYDILINPVNIMIVILLGFISFKVSKRIINMGSKNPDNRNR